MERETLGKTFTTAWVTWVGLTVVAIVIVWLIFTTTSCKTPTGTEVPDERRGSYTEGSSAGSNISSVGTVMVPNGEVTGTVRILGDKAYCKATNSTDETVPVYLAIYLRPSPQHRIALRQMDLRPGQTRSQSAPLLVCEGCGGFVRAQVDCVAYEEPPEIYVFGERMPGQMLDNTQWEKECPDCPPICKPVGDRECSEQTWDFKLCKFVGKCVCEPEGEGECQGQIWDTEFCQWTGDCPCVCDLPDPQSFYRKRSLGNPVSECAHFGLVVGTGECGIKLRKGGKCYEVTHESTLRGGPPKVCCDIPIGRSTMRWCYSQSHVTHCKQECPE